MRKISFFLIALWVLLVSGCEKTVPVPISDDSLASKIEKMAQDDFKALPTLSISGRIKISAKSARGSASMVMVYNPEKGLRLDVVDPIFRPLLSMLIKKETLWSHDYKSGKTHFGPIKNALKSITGFSMKGAPIIPIIFGKIPTDNVTAVKRKNNDNDPGKRSNVAFDLYNNEGKTRYSVGVNSETGRVGWIIILDPVAGKPLVLAEFSENYKEMIPAKVRISNLETGDFVLIRNTDVVSGVQIDDELFDPDHLGDLG